MNKKVIALLVLFAAPAAVPGFGAEVSLNGYFSAEYLQGQKESPWSKGSFTNAQAGLILSGQWSSQFGYALELRTKEGMRVEIGQAWAGWSAAESFQAKVGLFLVPFGRYNRANRPYETLLVDAPYPYGEAYPSSWREIGGMVEGSFGIFGYAAWIGNGLAESADPSGGQQFGDNNKGKAWGARLTGRLSEELELGASYYRGALDSENERNLTLLGADLGWMTQNIRLTAEYTRADIANPAPFAKGRVEGWYVLWGLVFGDWMPTAAYERSWTRDPYHGIGWAAPATAGAGLDTDHNRWALGLSYALHTNVLVKLEYDIQKESGLTLKDDVLRVQAAVHF